MTSIGNYVSKFVGGTIGFKIEEKMTGKHHFTEISDMDGTHPMSFTAEWGPRSIKKWMDPSEDDFLTHPMVGTVSVGGLCLDEEFSGEMQLRYFENASIRYEFDFEVDGTSYHYRGEKTDIRPWNLHRTHTTLKGEIIEVESRTVISRSTLHFRLASLPSMLLSFRLI